MDDQINDIVKTYWGFDSLRPAQEEAIMAVLKNQNVFVSMPTGGGKSLCFQVPAMLKPGVCIVISPLVALIKDQVEALKRKGIKAIGLAGYYSFYELDALLDNCIYGNYKFLYLSPERLQQELVVERIKKMPVNLIAIDEAHCVSQWGHDFRPNYRKIAALADNFPSVPKIALTASATSQVSKDIIENLALSNLKVVHQSFARKNIGYHLVFSEDKVYTALHILAQNQGSSIIYTTNRKSTETISNMLNKNGIRADYFHGGVTTLAKEERLNAWLNESIRVMVATNAFGMGIDKPNVRTVIHLNIPESIESYYQETGRAGRDEKPSKAFLVINNYDDTQVRNQFLKNLANTEQVKGIYKKLNAYLGIAYGELREEPFALCFQDFCTTYNLPSQLVYNALKTLDRLAVIQLYQNYEIQTKLMFRVSSRELLDYVDSRPILKKVVQTILRLYPGIFQNHVQISIEDIAKRLQLEHKEVIKVLQQLHGQGFADYTSRYDDTEILFLKPREDDRTINAIAKDISKQIETKTKHIADILEYVHNNTRCKALQIMDYFGERTKKPCGVCSVCASKTDGLTKRDAARLRQIIYSYLQANTCTSRHLALQHPDLEEQNILKILKNLLEDGLISLNTKNEYYVCKT